MRTLSLFSLLLVLVVGAAQAQPLTFASGGMVKIEGTSNVHGWSCDVPQYSGSITGTLEGGTPGAISQTTFTIPVAAIECKNGTMNGKLREALKAQQHSTIRFELTGARITPGEGSTFAVAATGRLTIAGQSRSIQMNVQGEALGNGRYRFTGSVPVTMSQYGIKPPTAMMGAMRTGDAVTVTFNLVASR